MVAAAFLIDPTKQSITKVNIVNNADVFRTVGGNFVSKRTPDNNLVHYLSAIYPPINLTGFSIRGMSDLFFGPGVITGSRPYRTDPFTPINFNDLDILFNILFLTHSPDSSGYLISQPKQIAWST